MARPLAAAAGVFVVLGVLGYARADTPLPDVVRASNAQTSERLKKLAGSTVEASTYIGSGSFYASGYYDRYVSLALFIRPTYDLGTRLQLSLNARIYLETELTQPDTPNGRRFYPYDPWLWLSAKNLHTFERSKIRIGGLVRTIWPLSYESRYQHLLFGVGAGLNATRAFVFGPANDEARQWTLSLTYVTLAYKYLQTSHFRGSGPGDTTGCLAPPSATGVPGITGTGGPAGAAADRCGGPNNPNVALVDAAVAALAHGKWSFAVTLLVSNTFEYDAGGYALTADGAVPVGRSDATWGILSLGYQLRPHVGLSAGLSSYQPALDSRYRYPRFPFFDLSGGANMNNFTQLFLSVNGSL